MQKTVNGVVTNYTLHGKNIVHMTQGDNNLHFFYDASSKPAIVEYNGTKYAYVCNLQGDIVAILDSVGNKVVQYAYDAWGRPIKKEGSLAETLGTVQPFRYRGYVFDEETGLFYLRSRYFPPLFCRYLNEDIGFSSIILLGTNLFSYCRNKAVNRNDPAGTCDCDSCYKCNATAQVPMDTLLFSPSQVINPYALTGNSGLWPNRADYVLVEWHAAYGTIDAETATSQNQKLNKQQRLYDIDRNIQYGIVEIYTDITFSVILSAVGGMIKNTGLEATVDKYLGGPLDNFVDEFFCFEKGIQSYSHNITACQYNIVAALYQNPQNHEDYALMVEVRCSDPNNCLNGFYFPLGFIGNEGINWTTHLNPSHGIITH